MTTKMSRWDIRRRHHGEVLEKHVLMDLVKDHVIEPINKWDGLFRPAFAQPYFESKDGSSECPLDEFGWVADEDRTCMMSCIIEVKAMRALDWHDWIDHRLLHKDKVMQRARHIHICRSYEFDGIAFIALNKDSSEIHISASDSEQEVLFEYHY